MVVYNFERFLAKNAAVDDSQHQEVVVISDDEENSDLVYVGTSEKEDGQQSSASGYLAGPDSSASSSFSVGTPPDYTEYLLLLYSGKGALIPESMRPPPRESKTSIQENNNDI